MTSEKNRRGTSTKRSVGAYGSKRGTPDKQVARARHRAAQKRNQAAQEAVEAARAALQARMDREAVDPAVGPAAGAAYVARRGELERELAKAEQEAEIAAQLEQEEQRRIDRELSTTLQRSGFAGTNLQQQSFPRHGWSRGQARSLIRHGYNVRYVIDLTGYGWGDLGDLALDHEGFGIIEED